MNITAGTVKQLRERTGAGMMECKKALVETQGDLDAAAELMRKTGLAKADKKAARVAAEGTVAVERAGNSAVLVEVNCETDFVARTPDFRTLAREIAMQVAATNPTRISANEESSDGDVPLLDQPYIRDSSKTIGELVNETIARVRENFVIRRFSRFELGGQ